MNRISGNKHCGRNIGFGTKMFLAIVRNPSQHERKSINERVVEAKRERERGGGGGGEERERKREREGGGGAI